MPINAQRNSSNTNKPQSRQNIFSSQSHASLEPRHPTSGLVAAAPRATNSRPVGAPNPLPLNVEGSFDISRDFARLPATPTEKRTNAVPTHTHSSQQGRGRLLQNGEGVLPASQSVNSTVISGMTAPRPRAQAHAESQEEPVNRGVPIDPDKLHTAFAKLQRPPRGVRQDKDRFSSDRAASRQPAAVNKFTRSQDSRRKSARSQKNSTDNRRTVPVQVWVRPLVKETLARLAASEGLSLSAAGGALLERALQNNVDMQYGALLNPVIEKAIARQMAGIATRLTWLLVRIAFDAGQTRSLVTNILGRQQGVTQPLLKTILEGSGRSAKANIMRRTPQIASLIEVVEQWILEEDEKGRQEKKSI